MEIASNVTWIDMVTAAALFAAFLGWSLRRLVAAADGAWERYRHLRELDRRTSGQRGLYPIQD